MPLSQGGVHEKHTWVFTFRVTSGSFCSEHELIIYMYLILQSNVINNKADMVNEIRQQLISNTSSRPHTLNFTEGLLPDKPTTAHTLLTLRGWRRAGSRTLGCLSSLNIHTTQVWIWRNSLHNHQTKPCNIWQMYYMDVMVHISVEKWLF